MAKCRAFVCDVCGEHLPSPEDDGALFIRAKRRWYGWYERGYTKHQLCICISCQKKIAKIVEERQCG